MAWNKSSGAPKVAPKKGPSKVRGIMAGLVVVCALGGLCLWMFSGGEDAPKAKPDKERGRIKEVTPAVVHTNAAPKAVKAKSKADHDAEFIKKMEAQYGDNMPPGLKAHIYYLKHPPKTIYKAKRDYPYLENQAERSIAALLGSEPGAFLLEPPKFDKSFDKNFVDSLLAPIKINDDDPADVKEMKAFVSDMKKELAAAVKQDGKDPHEIMNEQGQFMYELGRFEQQLAEQLREARNNPDLSDQDVKDMFEAANVLREKKGLPKRAVPTFTSRMLDISRQQRRKARQAEREAAAAAAAKQNSNK